LDRARQRYWTVECDIYGKVGRREDALAAVEELQEISKRQHVSPYWTGLIYVSLNDRDAALQWLERARREHAPWLAYIKVSPWFDSLRGDRGFDDLLRHMNFP
jgi:tetratricopeptide (TPR) repeat protein